MKNKINRILALVALCMSLGFALPAHIKADTAPVVGAVNFAFQTTGSSSLSVDMTPTFGEGGYHYYSLQSFFTAGGSSGLYAGIQTAGSDGQQQVGNMLIFSIWDATVAYPAEGVISTPFGGEGVGMSLRMPYDWSVGETYTVTIQRRGFDTAGNGYRWTAVFHDQKEDRYIEMGEILAPAGSNTLGSGHLFHERFSGRLPLCETDNPQLEEAGVIFSDLKSNVDIVRTGVSSNGIFRHQDCSDYIHVQIDQNLPIASGFGIDQETYITSWGGDPADPPITPSQPLPESNDSIQPPPSTVAVAPDPAPGSTTDTGDNANQPTTAEETPSSTSSGNSEQAPLTTASAQATVESSGIPWIGYIGIGLALLAAVLLGLIAHRNIKL